MRFIELHPHYEENPPGNKYIYFNCPTCPTESKCKIVIPVDNTEFPKKSWSSTGGPDFDTITLKPSLDNHCLTRPHFFITNGEVVFV